MRVPLFVELCAGTAALSLRLVHPRARPPVSRMGAKTGYANAILRVMGLRPGQGMEHAILCEPDPGCRLLLHAYTDRSLALAAADIIRGWKDEDPRALWERLRAEGPPVCEPVTGAEVARWAFLHQGSYQYRGVDAGIGRPEGREDGGGFGAVAPLGEMLPRTFAAVPTLHAIILTDARLLDVRPESAGLHRGNSAPRHTVLCGNCLSRFTAAAPDVTNGHLGEFSSRVSLADLGGSVADLVADVLLLAAPCEVCGAVVVPAAVKVTDGVPRGPWSMERFADKAGDPPRDSCPASAQNGLSVSVLVNASGERTHGVDGPQLSGIRDLILRCFGNCSPLVHGVPPFSTIPYGAASIHLPPGTVCYIDPSYVGTTSYSDNLPRSEVLTLARRWSNAGALVAISEAEPIEELEGWHAVEITGERVGQRRTFGGCAEWLTLNRPPAWAPAKQRSMFGGYVELDTGRA